MCGSESESESKIRRRSSGFMLTCVQFPFCLLPLLNMFLSCSYSNCVCSVIILIHTHINSLYILSSSGTWFRGIQREDGWSEADDTRVRGLHIYTHTVVGRCRYSQPKSKTQFSLDDSNQQPFWCDATLLTTTFKRTEFLSMTASWAILHDVIFLHI